MNLQKHRKLLLDACTQAVDQIIKRSEGPEFSADADAVINMQFDVESVQPCIGCHVILPLKVADGDFTVGEMRITPSERISP